MKHPTIKLTTAQFAKIHGINKRTLHYYDEIGLFSPCRKGSNQYRYYDYSQGIELEYIHMLKELNMTIKEIKEYLNNPNAESFCSIADQKLSEIDREIRRLKKTKNILKQKKEQLALCSQIKNKEIRLIKCEEEYHYILPLDRINEDIEQLYPRIKDAWHAEQYNMGIGSLISVEKIRSKNFEEYDALFTPAPKNRKSRTQIKPRGTYLCAFYKGDWNGLPDFYEEILKFAESKNLKLTGYSYEMGINDFVISSMDEYITQIMIRTDDEEKFDMEVSEI